jgi:hypothetical protein
MRPAVRSALEAEGLIPWPNSPPAYFGARAPRLEAFEIRRWLLFRLFDFAPLFAHARLLALLPPAQKPAAFRSADHPDLRSPLHRLKMVDLSASFAA